MTVRRSPLAPARVRNRGDHPWRRTYRPSLERIEDRTLLSAGALDTTFGNAGIATTPFGPPSNSVAVLVQPDDKVLVAATVSGYWRLWPGTLQCGRHTRHVLRHWRASGH